MSHDNEMPAPEQDAGLQMGIAKEVSPPATPEEIIFSKLDMHYASRARYGENKPFSLIHPLSDTLTPDELRIVFSNPANTGIYVADESDLQNLLHIAAWRQETLRSTSFVEDFGEYAFIRHYGNKAVVVHWVGDEMVHQTIPAFKHSHIDRFVCVPDPKTGGLTRRRFADVWLESARVRRYDGAEFLPGMATSPNVLNLWRGWPCLDVTDDSSGEPPECELFLNHIRDNLCGGNIEVYLYLLGWMADALQNPHRTSRVAVVLHGPQGSGKSLFATCFAQLFAPHSAVLARPEQLTGQFNKHLMDKCLVFADEAFFAGNRQQGAALKTLVTSETMFVEPKGVDGFMAPKRFRLIMASNDQHVIRAEIDDRRFLVLRVDAGEHNNSASYFSAVLDEWNSGGKRALFRWLRGAYWRRELEYNWRPEDRPKTRALELQKDLSLDPPVMAVLNMLREGEPPCIFLPHGEGIFVPTQEMADAVRLGTRDLKALGESLRIVAVHDASGKPKSIRRTVGNDQRRGFVLPPLTQARAQWETHHGRSVAWPDDITDWCFAQVCEHHRPGESDCPF